MDESERYTGMIDVSFTDSSEDVPDGYNNAAYVIQTNTTGEDADWTVAQGEPVTGYGCGWPRTTRIPGRFTIPSASDDEFMVRVVATAQHATTQGTAETPDIVVTSAPVTVAGIDPTASGVSAGRVDAEGDADAGGDNIQVSWSADSDDDSQFRVVVEMSPWPLWVDRLCRSSLKRWNFRSHR